MARALWIVALLAGPAAAETVKQPACHDPDPARPAAKTIRDVDWCNSDVGTWKGPMRAGRSSVHLYASFDRAHDTIATSLRGVIYGDLDGDARPEAAIIIQRTTWHDSRSTSSSTIHIYGFAAGAAKSLGSIPAGTPVTDVTFGKGTVAFTSGPAPATTTTYRWDAAKRELVKQP